MLNFKKSIHIFTEYVCLDLPRLNMRTMQLHPPFMWHKGEEMNGKEERDWRPQHQCQSQGRAEGCDGGLQYLSPPQRIKPTVEDVAQAASSCVKDTKKNGETQGPLGAIDYPQNFPQHCRLIII